MTSPAAPPRLSWETEPARALLRLAGPLVVSLLSMTVLNLVDTLFVGRLGAVPLAAAGLGGIAAFTIASFGLALFGAAKVKVGEAWGRGEHDAVRRALGAYLLLTIPLALVTAAVGLALARVLPLLGADAETGHFAARFLEVRLLSLPFFLATAALASWLGAQGQTRPPMRAALVGNGSNIALNAWFIFGLGWGVIGSAAATVIAQGIECAVLFWGSAPRGRLKASWTEAWTAFRVGLPTGTERVLDMLAFAAVPFLLARLGPQHVAAHQIVLQLSHLSFLPLIALSEGTSILVSQAVGAGRSTVIRQVARASLVVTMAYAALLATLFYGARVPLVRAFGADDAVLAVGTVTLGWAALLQFINAAYNVIKGILRGLSVFRYVAWVTVGAAWIVTPPGTALLGVRLGWGAPGAWVVLCFEVTVGTLLLAWRLKRHPIFADEPTTEGLTSRG